MWLLSSGAAVSGLDQTFLMLGGGARGSIGGDATWLLAVLGCLAIVGLLVYNRRQRKRFGFPLRPTWAEILLGIVGCLAVLGLAALANANYWPKGLTERYAAEHNIPIPPGGLHISTGIPWPIVLVIAVMLVMTFIATRRRFGRYVYAYGGNPGRRRAGWHQHPLDDHEDLHADGPALRCGRGCRSRPAQRRHPGRGHRR